jgi:uncharacterized protein
MSRMSLFVLCGLCTISGMTAVQVASMAFADDKTPAAVFEVYQDKAEEYRWRLKAGNNQILATASEGYKEKRSCLSAIESIKRDAPNAPIREEAKK